MIKKLYYRFKLFLYRLCVRENKFNNNLSFDIELFNLMNSKERHEYVTNLNIRRKRDNERKLLGINIYGIIF